MQSSGASPQGGHQRKGRDADRRGERRGDGSHQRAAHGYPCQRQAKAVRLLGHEEDIVIRWPDIQVIGDDTVLVNYQERIHVRRRRGLLSFLFGEE